MTARLEPEDLRWGFSTLGCPEMTFPEVCRLAAEFRIRDLEVRALNSRTDLPQYSLEEGLLPRRVRKLLDAFHGRIAVAASDFKLVGGPPSQRVALAQFCQWADALGIPYVRVFGGGMWGNALTKADFTEAKDNVQWWREQKRKHKWRTEILLETHDAFSASEPCVRLCTSLDEPLGLIWDSHHTWRLGRETPADSLSLLGPWIRHVHIKDSTDRPSARHPFTYVLPGDGEAPLGEILSLLRAQKFSGVVSLEWEKMWHAYLPGLREALVQLQHQPWYQDQKIVPAPLAQVPSPLLRVSTRETA
jgi:sugar phosphate isomerase/epimerase